HTPAGIESSLKAAAELSAAGPKLLRSIVPPNNTFLAPDVAPDGKVTNGVIPLTWAPPSAARSAFAPASAAAPAGTPPPPVADSNGDGVPDIIAMFHGTPQGTPESPVISLGADQMVRFKFAIDSDLFDIGEPFVLRNGYTWQISCSNSLTSWMVPDGEVEKSTVDGRTYLTAIFPADGPSCFARIEVVPPPPPEAP
ncbi:MAG: hypothetical protein ACRDBP_18435, partial [Luteolibacter sp.]